MVAIDLRGAWTGNRGILHRGTEIVRHHAGIAWITCLLEFRGRRIPQWAPGHYTPLFFPDEAVAFAAGHRPCAECRRPAFRAFLDALASAASVGPDGSGAGSPPARLRAPELDRLLDGQRRFPRTSCRRLHERPWRGLPDGAFVVLDDTPAVVIGDTLVEWTSLGYRVARPRPGRGRAEVLTPPATVSALAAGYPVQIDDRARSSAGQTRSSTEDSSSATDR